MPEQRADDRVDEHRIDDQHAAGDCIRIGFHLECELRPHDAEDEPQDRLDDEQDAEAKRGWIDRAEIHEVVDDAHPPPEAGEHDADDLVSVADRLRCKDDDDDAEEIGDDV